VLGLDGQGGAEMFADYWQWEQAAQRRPEIKSQPKEAAAPRTQVKKKLSYIEAREWEGMEQQVLEAESELAAAQAEMQSPEVASDGPRLQAAYQRMQTAEAKVAALYERWAELEAKQR
jgi:ATP-binding cassette subfamily F protein uup